MNVHLDIYRNRQSTFWVLLTMEPGPSKRFVETFKWAKKCVEWVQSHSPSKWFWEMELLPTSTWFSGYGCCETGLRMLNSAKEKLGGAAAFSPTFQFEINSRARQSISGTLPDHCCQHIDILRMLNDTDRVALKKLEKESDKPSEDLWNFLLDKKLVTMAPCSRHQFRWDVLI